MLLSQIAEKVEHLLNSPEITYVVMDNQQQYESYMTNRDGDKYTPAVITLTSSPFSFGYIATKSYNYQVRLYGYASEMSIVERDIRNVAKQDNIFIDDLGFVKFSNMYYDEMKTSMDGRNQRRFTAYFDVTVEQPINTIAGNQWKIKINGQDVMYKSLFFNQDKSLVSNIDYGDNNDVKQITENINIELPIKLGIESDVLLNVLSSNYNKKYTIELSIDNVFTKEVDVVLRGGTANIQNDSNASTFVARFQLALPRETFTVKYGSNIETIPLISLTVNMNKGLNTQAIEVEKGITTLYNKAESHTVSFTASFTSTDTIVSRQIKNDIESNLVMNSVYTIGLDGKNYNVMIANGDYTITENAGLYFNCSFVQVGDEQ